MSPTLRMRAGGGDGDTLRSMMEQERRNLGFASGSARSPLREIAFADLGRAVAADRDELDAAIDPRARLGCFVLGDEVAGLEGELPSVLGNGEAPRRGVGHRRDRAGATRARRGAGDEVVTQANTCVPTVAAIARAGATRSSATSSPGHGDDRPGIARGRGRSPTRAIVPVHLYGQVGPDEAVAGSPRRRDVPVVEDCAQGSAPAAAESRRAAWRRCRLQLLPDQEPRRRSGTAARW